MHKYEGKIQVGIVGARGYSGTELARILLRHPQVNLVACFAGEQGFALSDLLPESAAKTVKVLPLGDATSVKLDAVFLATPAEVSMELAPKFLEAGVNVIDLSGAFRLEAAAYPQWYGFTHSQEKTLEAAHYGLPPFSGEVKGQKASLLSNPGCFATSVLMAIVPLLKAEVIDPSRITIDSKSGTSGAGKKAAEHLLFTEVEGECLPYRVGKHQHLPEIVRWTKEFSGASIDPFFTTHLLPVRRGILSSIYCELKDGKTLADATQAFETAFAAYPLVRFGAIKDGAKNLSLRRVTGSARTHLQYEVAGKKLFLFSLLDNLLKGAASQAVENLNRLYHLPVDTALSDLEGTL